MGCLKDGILVRREGMPSPTSCSALLEPLLQQAMEQNPSNNEFRRTFFTQREAALNQASAASSDFMSNNREDCPVRTAAISMPLIAEPWKSCRLRSSSGSRRRSCCAASRSPRTTS